MYMYIMYVYMYILCMYVYVYYMYILYVCMYIYIYTCISLYIYIYMFLGMTIHNSKLFWLKNMDSIGFDMYPYI